MTYSVYIFWSVVFFRSVSLLHFCMHHPSNIETEVPYTVIVLLSISPFNSVIIWIKY